MKRDPVLFRATENTFPPDYIPVLYTWARQEFTPDDLLHQLAVLPLDFWPGAAMSYSNAGYTLLGLLIESVTATGYGEYLHQQILQPLGMTATRLVEDDIIPNFATSYTWAMTDGDNGIWRRGGYINPTRDAAGSLVSTIEDMARWDAAFYDDAFVSPKLREAMWTPALLNDSTPLPYGLSWAVGTANGGTGTHAWVGHSGMWGGFTSQWLRFPEDRLTVIVLTNLGISGRVKDGGQRGDPATLAWQIAGQFLPGMVRP